MGDATCTCINCRIRIAAFNADIGDNIPMEDFAHGLTALAEMLGCYLTQVPQPVAQDVMQTFVRAQIKAHARARSDISSMEVAGHG